MGTGGASAVTRGSGERTKLGREVGGVLLNPTGGSDLFWAVPEGGYGKGMGGRLCMVVAPEPNRSGGRGMGGRGVEVLPVRLGLLVPEVCWSTPLEGRCGLVVVVGTPFCEGLEELRNSETFTATGERDREEKERGMGRKGRERGGRKRETEE